MDNIEFSAHAIWRYYERFAPVKFKRVCNHIKDHKKQEVNQYNFADAIKENEGRYSKLLSIFEASQRAAPTKSSKIKYLLKNPGNKETNFYISKQKIVFVVREQTVITCVPYSTKDFTEAPEEWGFRKIKHYNL